MSWLTSVTIENRDLGISEIGLCRTHDEWHAPHSIAYFCHHCGRLWARIYVIPREGREDKDSWRVYTMPCKGCGLGSVYVSFEPEHMDALPIDVMKQEFLLQLEDPEWYFMFPWRQRLIAYDDLLAAKLPDF